MSKSDMPDASGKSKAKSEVRDSDLWYKRYPRVFKEATSKMPFELRAAYGLVIDLYYEHGGPLPNDDKWIACALFIDVRKWKPIRKGLFAHGKLYLGPDHQIHNDTADDKIAERDASLEATSEQASKRRSHGQVRKNLGQYLPRNLATTSVGTGGDFSEKPNGNKEGARQIKSKIKTVEEEEEYQSTSTSTTTVESSQSEEAKIFEASLDVIDLQTYRIDLSARAKFLIADMGIAVEDVMRRARDAARQQRKPITHQDLYCVAIAAREVDPTLSKPAASRYAKRLLNGEDAQAPPADARRHALTPEQLKRTTAPASLRSNLTKTGLLSRK